MRRTAFAGAAGAGFESGVEPSQLSSQPSPPCHAMPRTGLGIPYLLEVVKADRGRVEGTGKEKRREEGKERNLKRVNCTEGEERNLKRVNCTV